LFGVFDSAYLFEHIQIVIDEPSLYKFTIHDLVVRAL
jgi:hypothetical protein